MSTAEKNPHRTVFDCIDQLLTVSSFRSKSFTDKMDLYFSDFSMMSLMVAENYLKNDPVTARDITNATVRNGRGPQGYSAKDTHALEVLQCLSNAADSISDGDLTDSLLREYVVHVCVLFIHCCQIKQLVSFAGAWGHIHCPPLLFHARNAVGEQRLGGILVSVLVSRVRVRLCVSSYSVVGWDRTPRLESIPVPCESCPPRCVSRLALTRLRYLCCVVRCSCGGRSGKRISRRCACCFPGRLLPQARRASSR